MVEATKNRDFAEAAAGQSLVDEAQKKLADALAAEDGDEEAETRPLNSVITSNGETMTFEALTDLEKAIERFSSLVTECVEQKQL